MINLLHLGQKHSYLMDQFKKDKKKKKKKNNKDNKKL